ncbi:MAG TPA: class I SAM-dependent methyltransferase [Burkholderiales bacterium]|nr:class I SAM-dependent methyltransferase [Burkholderiales bacterium]
MSGPLEPPRRSALEFFDRQFERQVEARDYGLNPFERAVLPHLSGDVLDLGCGLGNLALEAAGRGCRVTALDSSSTAIADLARRAGARGIALEAHSADLRHYVPARDYDCVVSIGLLMFFACGDARRLLARMREAVRPGGLTAVNVLIEGTTYLDMFDPEACCLFGHDELSEAFSGWEVALSRHEDFPAPSGTLKRFHTLLARNPARP